MRVLGGRDLCGIDHEIPRLNSKQTLEEELSGTDYEFLLLVSVGFNYETS